MLGKLFGRKQSTAVLETARADQGREQFNYCPSCGDEFRAEFDHCASCNKPLVSGRAPNYALQAQAGGGQTESSGVVPLSPEDNLVSVKQGSLMEMKQVRHLLERNGIASLIAGDGPDCTRSCCGGSSAFILQIRQEDQDRAGNVLSDDFIRSTALDSHNVRYQSSGSGSQVVPEEPDGDEISCPACGLRFVGAERTCPECGLCC